MLLTLLLHMNLINDLSHLSLAQWVGRPTNVWHPLARDITNITSSSTHYIPIKFFNGVYVFLQKRQAALSSPTRPFSRESGSSGGIGSPSLAPKEQAPLQRKVRGVVRIPGKITERHASLGYKTPFAVFSTFD